MRRSTRVAVLLAAGAGFVAAFLALARPPAGPVEPAWDRTTCAHCRMHLSEPAFAAQLHATTGEVLFFDDPGCLFAWRSSSTEDGRAWFLLATGEWRPESETRFAAVARSPMGFGLAAVDDRTPGAVTAAEAARRVVAPPVGGTR